MKTGCVYELFSPSCNKTYIGSTIQNINKRVTCHRSKKHPIFDYDDVQVRVLAKDVPEAELRKKEGEYIRKKWGNLFNTRIAGRTCKEKYYENWEESKKYHREQYVPKKNGGDGSYRQLQRYACNKYEILRRMCINNAIKLKRPPTKTSQTKYNFTLDELKSMGL